MPPAPSMIGISAHYIVGLELGLDHEIDMAGGEHAVGVAVAAIARQPHRCSTRWKAARSAVVHQQRAGGEQHGIVQSRAQARTRSAGRRPGRDSAPRCRRR